MLNRQDLANLTGGFEKYRKDGKISLKGAAYNSGPYYLNEFVFNQSNFSECKLVNVLFDRCTFESCVLDEAIFESCRFENCVFSNVAADAATFTESTFICCTLINSNFENGYFEYDRFFRSEIKNCNLKSATCRNTEFKGCKSFSNNIEGMKIFLDESNIDGWKRYELQIRSFFQGQRAFKSVEQKRAEQEYIKWHIRIIEYANTLGFHVVKKGKYYSLKEHDSVMIDAEKNCFWRNSNGAKGSVIDFAVEFTQKSVSEVIQEFASIVDLGDSEQKFVERSKVGLEKEEKTIFKLPQRDNSIKNVSAYLLSIRQIDKNIVSMFLNKKYLYQDIHKNCVFVSYKDNEPVYAGLRGTNTDYRFIGDVAGSDYDWCFFINNNSKKLIVTESVIDIMSIMSIIKQKGYEVNDYDWLALTSTQKYESLFYHERQKVYEKIYLALDNDNAGIKCCYAIRQHGFFRTVEVIDWLPQDGKDWNDVCKFINTGIKCKVEVPL